MIRVFIAVNLPDDIRDKLSDVVSELEKTGAHIRWVPAENMHISTARHSSSDGG